MATTAEEKIKLVKDFFDDNHGEFIAYGFKEEEIEDAQDMVRYVMAQLTNNTSIPPFIFMMACKLFIEVAENEFNNMDDNAAARMSDTTREDVKGFAAFIKTPGIESND